MSHHVNDQIREWIVEEVSELSNRTVVNEVLNRPKSSWNISPSSDSWDEFFSFADMDKLRNDLVEKRYSEWPEAASREVV